MSGDDDFEPHLGKIRSRGGSKARRYVSLITAATVRAGLNVAGASGPRSRRFDGSRIGRGASFGRVLSSRSATLRRATVKTRLVRLSGTARAAAGAHLRYLKRDGVTREGQPGQLYGPETDAVDGKAFIEKSGDDRHQFRIIVSAEDGGQYDDLKPFTRRLMAQVEADLGTRLEWVAVDHFNTAHPHTHIILRGVDERGRNLVIAREYIAEGFRARATERATLDLGPRTQLEIEARQRIDVGASRMTALDRSLLRDADTERVVFAGAPDPHAAALRAGRLRTLQSFGLARDVGRNRWQLADDLEATLRAMGERGDIIRTLQRELTARRLDRSSDGSTIFNIESDGTPLVGRVIARGLADEHRDRHYLLVDAVDGKAHYVDIGRGEMLEPLADGAIVRIARRPAAIRDADRTIVAVAAANGGRYSSDLHLRHDRAATQAFADTHVRRLEAIRRSVGLERDADGSWRIGTDHLDKVDAHEARQRRDRPVAIDILSPVPVESLTRADAATWLDRELASETPQVVRDAGFGRDLRNALAVRRQWLVEQKLIDPAARDARLRGSVLAALQRRELMRIADELSLQLGKPFAQVSGGDDIRGTLTRKIDALGGQYAVVEKSREFTLVPWRPVLSRHLGKQVQGIVRKGGIGWTIGRSRGPEIS